MGISCFRLDWHRRAIVYLENVLNLDSASNPPPFIFHFLLSALFVSPLGSLPALGVETRRQLPSRRHQLSL
jgi:hypothetical protein